MRSTHATAGRLGDGPPGANPGGRAAETTALAIDVTPEPARGVGGYLIVEMAEV
jgi:hypothetical protein